MQPTAQAVGMQDTEQAPLGAEEISCFIRIHPSVAHFVGSISILRTVTPGLRPGYTLSPSSMAL